MSYQEESWNCLGRRESSWVCVGGSQVIILVKCNKIVQGTLENFI